MREWVKSLQGRRKTLLRGKNEAFPLHTVATNGVKIIHDKQTFRSGKSRRFVVIQPLLRIIHFTKVTSAAIILIPNSDISRAWETH